VTIPVLETKLDELIHKLPRTSGADPAQALGRDANNVILRAGSVLKQFGDEFITPEHLVLALVQGNGFSEARRIVCPSLSAIFVHVI